MHTPDTESDGQTVRGRAGWMCSNFCDWLRGKGAMTSGPTRSTVGFQVSRPPPPVRKRMSCLPEGEQVAPGRGSQVRGKEPQGIGICRPSSQNRAYGIPWLVWGRRAKPGGGGSGKGRGSRGHKPRGLNLNITSIKAWPKYCGGEAQFSTQPFLRLELIPWLFYTCSDRF